MCILHICYKPTAIYNIFSIMYSMNILKHKHLIINGIIMYYFPPSVPAILFYMAKKYFH